MTGEPATKDDRRTTPGEPRRSLKLEAQKLGEARRSSKKLVEARRSSKKLVDALFPSLSSLFLFLSGVPRFPRDSSTVRGGCRIPSPPPPAPRAAFMPILGKEFGSWMQAEHARTPASTRRMPGAEGLVGGCFTFHLLSTPGAEGLLGGDFTFHLLSTRGCRELRVWWVWASPFTY